APSGCTERRWPPSCWWGPPWGGSSGIPVPEGLSDGDKARVVGLDLGMVLVPQSLQLRVEEHGLPVVVGQEVGILGRAGPSARPGCGPWAQAAPTPGCPAQG